METDEEEKLSALSSFLSINDRSRFLRVHILFVRKNYLSNSLKLMSSFQLGTFLMMTSPVGRLFWRRILLFNRITLKTHMFFLTPQRRRISSFFLLNWRQRRRGSVLKQVLMKVKVCIRVFLNMYVGVSI